MFKRLFPIMGLCFLFLAVLSTQSHAESYAVAPFKVSGSQGYSYLSQAVPSMLNSRLFLQGRFEPVAKQDALLKEKAPNSDDGAKSLAKRYGADYFVWGTVTVMGENASIDVNALSPKGKIWKKAVNSTVNTLMAGMQSVADSVNREVFGRTDVAASPARPAGNSAFVYNNTGTRDKNGDVFLNPALRYQGSSQNAAQIRSQILNFEGKSMDIADVNGDGRNEVLILTGRSLFVYALKNGNHLDQLAEYQTPSTMDPIRVCTFKSGPKTLVALAGNDSEELEADSQILEFRNGNFVPVAKHVRFYLNVVSLPPLFTPVLIGQQSNRSSFVEGGIYEMLIQPNGKVARGGLLANLPRNANIFNFTWIPADKGKKEHHVALIHDNETLGIYDTKRNMIFGTDEIYSGSSVFVEGDRRLGGTGARRDRMDDPSAQILNYVAMRMPVTDLDHDGRYELIINKPVTAMGKLLSNYRTYPQGEIHALQWEGMGMELLWKTRRVKGTVNDVAVADVDNNGQMDLVVLVNSYGGFSEALRTRCCIYMYPLDSTKVNAKPNYSE